MQPFHAEAALQEQGRILKFLIREGNRVLTHEDVIAYWTSNEPFRRFFIALLKDAGMKWYVWEMPPLTLEQMHRPFECVLVAIPPRPRRPDHASFAGYFNPTGGDHGVVAFENLGRDALLIAPSPFNTDDDYAELAAFLQHAPESQVHALWRVLGLAIQKRLSDRPLWVSVAGGGVAWLHVRLDTYPKYYRYAPYRMRP